MSADKGRGDQSGDADELPELNPEAEEFHAQVEAHLDRLPHRFQVAFAVRCAQRALAFAGASGDFREAFGDEVESHVDAIVKAIELAQQSAEGHEISESELKVAILAAAKACQAAHVAARAADAARAAGLAVGAPVGPATRGAGATAADAEVAIIKAVGGAARAASDGFSRDMRMLRAMVSEDSDIQLVPAAFFKRTLWEGSGTTQEQKAFLTWLHRELLPNFRKACAEIGRDDLYERWEKLIEAAGTPLSTVESPSTASDGPSPVDHLNRTPLVEALANLLTDAGQATPTTLTLFGDWGAGKSTVMGLVQERMETLLDDKDREDRVAGVERAEFNAWSYEDCGNLRAALAHEVAKGLTARLSTLRKVAIALRRGLARASSFFRVGVVVLVFALLLYEVSIVAYGLAHGSHPGHFWEARAWSALEESIPMTNKGALPHILAAGWVGLGLGMAYLLWQMARHPLAVNVASFLQLPSYRKHLGTAASIQRDLRWLTRVRLPCRRQTNFAVRWALWWWDLRRRLVSLFVSRKERGNDTNKAQHAGPAWRNWHQPNRLIVWIDDLDRCQPEAIMEVLEAAKLVMDLRGVIVVLLVDPRIAFSAVERHFKEKKLATDEEATTLARDYLGKIIQVPITLPEPTNEDVLQLVKDDLFRIRYAKTSNGLVPEGARLDAGAEPDVAPKGSEDGEPKAGASGGGSTTAEPGTPAGGGAAEALVHDPIEQIVFAALTAEQGFTNPRQLKRLHNSYRLLRAWASQPGSPVASILIDQHLYAQRLALMAALFALEGMTAEEGALPAGPERNDAVKELLDFAATVAEKWNDKPRPPLEGEEEPDLDDRPYQNLAAALRAVSAADLEALAGFAGYVVLPGANRPLQTAEEEPKRPVYVPWLWRPHPRA